MKDVQKRHQQSDVRHVFRPEGASINRAKSQPGKPEMKVVLSTKSGILALSFRSSFSVWARGGRFIPSRVTLLMCWSGISMYLQTCRNPRIGTRHLFKHQAKGQEWSYNSSCQPKQEIFEAKIPDEASWDVHDSPMALTGLCF